MGLSVSYNQKFSSGIDTASLKEVTQQIFQKSSVKSVDLSTVDLTKFNKVSLGMDLYSGKVDASVARQIAMNNSSMQVNLSEKTLESLKYLNSQAFNSVFKNVEGKVALPEMTEAPKAQRFELPKFNSLVKTTDLGKDKNGSNPFYKGELVAVKKEDEKEELSIFA